MTPSLVVTIVVILAMGIPLFRRWRSYSVKPMAMTATATNRTTNPPPVVRKASAGWKVVVVLGFVCSFMLAASLVVRSLCATVQTAVASIQRQSDRNNSVATSPNTLQVCPGAKDIFLTLESPKEDVALQPNCWSGLVRLPEWVNYLVENDPAPWMEYKFLNGNTARITNEEKWFPDIPHSAFRLRGTDVAKIRIEPR